MCCEMDETVTPELAGGRQSVELGLARIRGEQGVGWSIVGLEKLSNGFDLESSPRQVDKVVTRSDSDKYLLDLAIFCDGTWRRTGVEDHPELAGGQVAWR